MIEKEVNEPRLHELNVLRGRLYDYQQEAFSVSTVYSCLVFT